MISNTIIGFIGGGNMARAIAEGMLKKGLIKNSDLMVSSPSEETLEYWKSLSVRTTHSNADVVMKADIIILAFKPYQLNTVMIGIKEQISSLAPSKLFVSILAGVPSSTIHGYLRNWCREGRIIRVMPNTLTLIGEGCSGVAAHSSATPQDAEIVKQIFTALGKCEVVPENLLSAVTGVSGSGPAYIYTVIEALSDGGVKQGLPRNLATTFAAQTVLGAAKMVLETKKHPAQLKDEVCSAGGTTIHAVHALERGGLRDTLINAVEAATKRADEISTKISEEAVYY